MAEPTFDPSKSVTFDLERGRIRLGGSGAPVLVPAEAVVELCAAAGPAAALAFGRSLGCGIGKRVVARLGAPEGVRAARIEEVVDHLGGEVALAGLGELGLERWGQALVVVLDGCPFRAEGDAVVEVVLAEAIKEAAGRPVCVLLLQRDGVRARFLVGSSRAIERVRGWLSAGAPWGEALVRLHAGEARGGA